MKLLLLAGLALFTATPALAQSDAYSVRDWYWLDLDGSGKPGRIAMLADGAIKRDGDKAEVDIFMVYREPDEHHAAGGRIHARFDCAAKMQAGDVATIFMMDGTVTDLDIDDPKPMKAIETTNIVYRFVCTSDRAGITHFGKRPRTALAEELFAR